MLALVLVFSPSEWLNRACFHWFAVMGIFFNEFNHYKTKSESGQVFTPEHIHGLHVPVTRMGVRVRRRIRPAGRGAYAAELKNVTATADGKPVQGFDPTKTGTWTIPAGTQVNIVDMPDDWKLDGKAEQPAGTVVFTASKYGTPVVTWTFKNDSATDPDKPADPGTDALKNVAATADGKPIAGFDPTRDGAYKVAAGAKVRISDVPSDWKLDKTESGSKLVFTASKGGTAVTWTFEYQANGGSSATDPGNGGGSNAGGDGQGDPGKTPDTSKPAASPKPAGTADDGQAAGAAPLASTGAGTGPAIAVAGLLAMAGASLLAAVARTRRHGADPDGLTAD